MTRFAVGWLTAVCFSLMGLVAATAAELRFESGEKQAALIELVVIEKIDQEVPQKAAAHLDYAS